MDVWRVEKCNARFRKAIRHLFWSEIDLDAKEFEDVRAAGVRREGAVTVFGDMDTAGSNNDGDGG